ncbi:hypothetical protein SEVCU123_2112 [Staphylococcus epidermidis VCU123]|nr:hypothetical protein SEVCU123_2112 [Staphylococcus epidermidis VCU123]
MIELKIYTHIKPFFTRGWGPNKENFTVNSTFLAPLFD